MGDVGRERALRDVGGLFAAPGLVLEEGAAFL